MDGWKLGNKKYKDKHRALGLCRNCSNPVENNKSLCSKCFERNRKYDRINSPIKKQKRKDENKCPQCGINLSEEDLERGLISCMNCRLHIHSSQGQPYYIGFMNE